MMLRIASPLCCELERKPKVPGQCLEQGVRHFMASFGIMGKGGRLRFPRLDRALTDAVVGNLIEDDVGLRLKQVGFETESESRVGLDRLDTSGSPDKRHKVEEGQTRGSDDGLWDKDVGWMANLMKEMEEPEEAQTAVMANLMEAMVEEHEEAKTDTAVANKVSGVVKETSKATKADDAAVSVGSPVGCWLEFAVE
jgi:hypothetical protein